MLLQSRLLFPGEGLRLRGIGEVAHRNTKDYGFFLENMNMTFLFFGSFICFHQVSSLIADHTGEGEGILCHK